MKIKKRFLLYGLVILLLYLTVLPPVHIMAADEDFSTYTEYDENGKITVSSSEVQLNDIEIDDDGAVYYDFGADYFDEDWTLNFETHYHASETITSMMMMLFTTAAPTAGVGAFPYTLIYNVNSPDAIGIYGIYGSTYMTYGLIEHKVGSPENEEQECLVPRVAYQDATLYGTLYFDDDDGTYGTMYIEMYSDSGRTVLIDSGDLVLTEENSWRYLSVFTTGGYSGSSSLGLNTSVTALEVIEGNPPAIEFVSNEFESYDPYEDEYYYALTSNITSGAGVDHYVTYYWKEDGDPSYQSQLLQSTYEEGETPHWYIVVEDGITYWWYAEIWSAEFGYFDFDPVSFTANVTEHIAPMMSISLFSTSNDFGDSWAFINGGVWYDGGDNVTGYIQYSENTTDWTDSAGTENLTSNDDYSANLTGLSQNTPYYYRAKGVNVNGTGYSPIGTFELGDWTDPTVSLSHSNVTGNTADITANLTFDGNDDECYVNIHYRVSGTSTWYGDDWGGVYLSENETTTWTLTGLAPSTTYEYRAVAWNQCYLNADCDFYFTDTFQFTTTGVSGTPSANLTIVGYQDDYTAYGTAEVLNDSGRPCKISLEYKAVGSSYTYWSRNIYIHPEQYCDGLEEGDTCTTFVTDLVLGNTYHFRARIENDLGFFSYSNIVTYKLERGTSSTTPGGGGDDLEIASGLRAWLAQFGLDNESGRALFVFIVMIACWLIVFIPGRRWMELIAVTAPVAGILDAVVLIIAMVINFVPVWATVVVVVVFAGVIAGLAVKVFGMRRGSA